MKTEIKARIEQIKRGEVPQGYKKTKIGIVPSEWESKKINHYIELCERPIEMDDNTEYQLVTVRRFYNGIDTRGMFLGSKILVKTQFLVKAGDYIISKRQISHGACGVLPIYLDGSIVSNEYNVFTSINKTDTNFFNLFMQKPRCQNLFYLMSDGIHIEKLLFKTSHWLKQKIALPPLREQQKIAKILTTQDKVIELKEKLIAEKQQQKKYLMQSLLTGKKRLKGFRDEWEITKLANYITENSIRNKELKVLRVLSVSNKHGFINQGEQFGKAVASKDLSNYKIIERGTIAYNPSRINVGSIALFKEDTSGIVSPLYVVMKCEKELLSEFFMFFTETNAFFEKMKALLSGGVRDTLNFKDLCEMKINLPPLSEQTAIAEILSTADKEIELIQKQLTEEKQKKKALMQLLLTGIVRV